MLANETNDWIYNATSCSFLFLSLSLSLSIVRVPYCRILYIYKEGRSEDFCRWLAQVASRCVQITLRGGTCRCKHTRTGEKDRKNRNRTAEIVALNLKLCCTERIFLKFYFKFKTIKAKQNKNHYPFGFLKRHFFFTQGCCLRILDSGSEKAREKKEKKKKKISLVFKHVILSNFIYRLDFLTLRLWISNFLPLLKRKRDITKQNKTKKKKAGKGLFIKKIYINIFIF